MQTSDAPADGCLGIVFAASESNHQVAHDSRLPTRTITEPNSAGSLGEEADFEGARVAMGPLDAPIPNYEIVRKLGHGGMGRVFLARDLRLGRLVAIKMLHGKGSSSSRMLAEARATARAKHDHIVDIYDVGTVGDVPYMILEYLEGETLREALTKVKKGTGRAIPHGLALDIVTAVLQALCVAHDHGIIHRDLKPENVMLLDSGHVKLLDFGLARNIDATESAGTRGTRAYMAPEQWRGEEIDQRTDIWAVGLILFELIEGTHPLAPLANNRLAGIADLDLPMPSLKIARSDLHGLGAVIDRCLRKRKEERFDSAKELLMALEAFRAPGRPLTTRDDESPFAGLSAFQESDADRFFGRDRDISTMLGWLRRHAIVAVVGASGAGKSSFVRAGVIPALKRSGEEWQVIVVRPGGSPLAALTDVVTAEEPAVDLRDDPGLFAACLRARCSARGANHRLVLFVDQFEELFTLVSDPVEQRAFLACLLGAADDETSPLRVVLAIRADFWDRLGQDRIFLARVREGLFFLPPITREGLLDALVRPLDAVGYAFESASIIEGVVEDVSHSRVPLPLLQFAASALWESRDVHQRLLTKTAYEKLGGVAGALSAHADAVVMGLSADEQRLCRAILLRLVTPERTRAMVSLREFEGVAAGKPALDGVLQALVSARLLLLDTNRDSDDTHIELVHESLIEQWPTLVRWLDESAGDAHFRTRLRAASGQWEKEGQPSGLLWRDRAAEEARSWYERYVAVRVDERQWLGATEERYLHAVISFQRRSRRTRRALTIGSFLFLSGVSLVVFVLAVRAREQAQRADDEAARVRQRNEALALEALKGRNATRILAARKMQDDPTSAFVILREVELPELPRDWGELMSTALTNGVAHAHRKLGVHPAYGASFHPDGSRLALSVDDSTVRIINAHDLAEITVLRGHTEYVWGVAWSPDGKRIATASGDKTARIWNADGSGEPIVLRGHTAGVNTASVSSNGRWVVTASEDKTALLHDLTGTREIAILKHDDAVNSASFSLDGKRIVTASADGLGRVWNVADAKKPMLLRGHKDAVVTAEFHPHGGRIVTGGKDATVRVWDASTGAELFVLRGHQDKIMSVAWSPDGKRIASASKDKTVRVWDGEGVGDPIVLRGQEHWIYAVRFSPDNQRLVTTSLDKSVRLWNLDEVIAPRVLRGHDEVTRGMEFSPDSQWIATASEDTKVRLWRTDVAGAPIVLPGVWAQNNVLHWAEGGVLPILGSADESAVVNLWFADHPTEIMTLRGHLGPVTDIRIDSRRERIVTVSGDGTARLWNLQGHEIGKIVLGALGRDDKPHIHLGQGNAWALIYDNHHETAYVWNMDQPEEIMRIGPHDGSVSWAKWLPDGKQVITATAEGIVRVWPVSESGAPVRVPIPGLFKRIELAPDGRRIAVSWDDGTIHVHSVDGEGEPIVISQPGNPPKTLHWSPDGTRILADHEDSSLHVWNANGSGVPFFLRGSLARVVLSAWSPNGAYIGVQSEEYAVRVWPVVHPLSGPNDPRLWRATSYCLTPQKRVELLGITEEQANEQVQTCTRRVAEATHE